MSVCIKICHSPIWRKMHFEYIVSHREDYYGLYIHQALFNITFISSVFTEMKTLCIQVKQVCIFFHPPLVRIPAGRNHLARFYCRTCAGEASKIIIAQKLGQIHTSGQHLCYRTCTQKLLKGIHWPHFLPGVT